jgi:hypothetical protein
MWENNEIQFARLLCELVAGNESLNLMEVADSMDLGVGKVHEILDRAHKVFEKSKTDGPRVQFEFEANRPNQRYWLGIQVNPNVQVDVGVLHNADGLSIDVWKDTNEDGPKDSAYWSWSDILSGEDLE